MAEGNYNTNNVTVPTFVALPIDAFQTNTQTPEQFHVIKNAIIKTLSDGSLCILEANNLQDGLSKPVEVTHLPASNHIIQPDADIDSPQIICNSSNNDPMEAQKPSPIYKCPKCKEIFEKIASYRKHMVWHRNVKKYKCDKCSAGYNVELNLKIHMAMHGEGTPTCPICSISFQRLASLKSHLLLHQVEELYTCEECGAEFEKEEELNKHSQNHLSNTVHESANLVCSYCNVQFEDRKNFKEHITHHIKVKKMVLSGKKSRKTNGNKNYPHICSVCLKSFSKVSLLERHLRVHSGERPFICEHCNKGFNQKGTLQIHLSKHTGIKPFHCTLCSAKFNQKGNLRVHVEKTHTAPMPGVKMYKCPHCTCIFKKIASLNVHITKCHASSEEIGDIVSVMNQLKELEKHTAPTPEMKESDKIVTEQNKKVLNEMKKAGNATSTSYVRLAESFLDGTVRRYLVMQKKVNDVKWYICSYCSKEFKKPSDLIRHTRVHTREKPFSCKQCGASFALKSTLFYHVKTHGSSTDYVCNTCMKKFSTLRSLNMHLRKHKPQYKCLHCNKWFSSVQRAKFHEKESHNIQTSEVTSDQVEIEMKRPLLNTTNDLLPVSSQKTDSLKQYQCPICVTKFSKMSNLKRHMLLHTDERKYKCTHCKKSYFTAQALKEHLTFHSGVRNYGCKVCGKKFMTPSLLKRHLTTHSSNRPYICPYCSKNFKSLVLCKKHILNIHRKEAILQAHDIDDTTAVKTVNESEKTEIIEMLPGAQVSSNLILNSDNQETNCHNLNLNRAEPIKPNLIHQECGPTVTQTQLNQQLYETPSNSIQIITNSDTILKQNLNEVETIYINCEDLQLSDNLYSNNTDTLFNTLNDLQDNTTFSIDSVDNNFDTQNVEVYNPNEALNTCDTHNIINVVELNNKVLKLNGMNVGITKPQVDKQNAQLNDTVLTGNLPYYSQSDLNLLLSLGPEFETSNCDLHGDSLNLSDINLNEVPLLNCNSQEDVEEKDKNEKKLFTCTKCNKAFTNKRMFMKHLQTHRDNRRGSGSFHQCNFCQKNFKKYSDLVRHIRTHTGEKPFACDQCERRFTLKSTLISHQRTHNPVIHKQFSCVVCNSFFSSKSSLKVHMSVHTGDKTHKCNFCPNKFRTAAHRKSHENNFHMNSSKKRTKNKVTNLLASVAMDVLSSQVSNNSHNEQGITSDLENVLVVQDQMQFPKDSLNIINETNTDTLPDVNPLEPLIFQQLQPNMLLSDNLIPSSLIQLDDGTLLNVKKVNTRQEVQQQNVDNVILPSEKPRNFQCDICQKKYASKDVLRKHKKIHGLDKIFRCTKCEKGFDSEVNLETHEKTHEGYRPFSCLYCANSFSREHSLTTHMRRIHNISLKDFLL